ncbi:MAG: cytochrome P450 [Rhodoferax sp.]
MKPVIPDHVPPERVVDFDRFTSPVLQRCPHQGVSELFRNSPDIFYTTGDRGHWVVGSATVARDMLRQPDKFSSDPVHNPANARKPPTLPNQCDPPLHTELRRIINPFFSPAGVQKMEQGIRQLAGELIDGVLARGHCEFVHEIAQRFPVELFMRMANAPLQDREMLVAKVDRFTRAPDIQERLAALGELGAYLHGMIVERQHTPGEDLVSLAIHGTVQGRALTDDEKQGMVNLLFLGGLDTVAAMLSFIMAYLGQHPAQYRRLVDNPPLIANAIEELMRVHGVAGMERGVTADMEYAGVQFKAKDRLVFLPHVYGLDAQMVEDPMRVDFDRPVSSHLVFGSGPHRCVGSHLARLEMKVFIEEWVRRVPAFAVDAPGDLPTRGGLVWSPVAVPLVWPTDAAVAGSTP